MDSIDVHKKGAQEVMPAQTYRGSRVAGGPSSLKEPETLHPLNLFSLNREDIYTYNIYLVFKSRLFWELHSVKCLTSALQAVSSWLLSSLTMVVLSVNFAVVFCGMDWEMALFKKREEEWAEDTPLWCPGVQDESAGSAVPDPDSLRSFSEEV